MNASDIMTWQVSFEEGYYVLDDEEYCKTVNSLFFTDKSRGYTTKDIVAICLLEVGQSLELDDGYQVITRTN